MPTQTIYFMQHGLAVDKAEDEPMQALLINGKAVQGLAGLARKYNCSLVHISTDYVFDGTANEPYKESQPVSPLGVYGASKEAGEQEVRSRLEEHVILRTSWVYGVHGHNFVKTMLRLAREHQELRVVADQWGCPTSAADLGKTLLDIAQKINNGTEHWGTYHCCGATTTTWHGFAETLFELCADQVALQVENVVALTTDEYPTPAKRPAYSVLDCHKLAHDYQIKMPDLRTSLNAVVGELLAEEQHAL